MPDQHLTLDERLASSLAKIGSADVVVGIPSFRNAATIGYVATTAAKGLREHFPDARVAIVNADGGSEDGTPDRVRRRRLRRARRRRSLHRTARQGLRVPRDLHRCRHARRARVRRRRQRPAQHHARVDRTPCDADHRKATPTTSLLFMRVTSTTARSRTRSRIRSPARCTACGSASRSAASSASAPISRPRSSNSRCGTPMSRASASTSS